jgi:CDGSH-type Zn-finger protein
MLSLGTKSTWTCMCGLGSNQPFCESHKKTADEEDNKIIL